MAPARVSLDQVLKLTSIASALLYGLLFLAYRSYFSRLGINPEEVGITNTYVLVRAIGFIGTMACIAGGVWLMRYISLQFSDHWRGQDLLLWGGQLGIWVVLAAYAYRMAPASWPSVAVPAVAAGPVVVGIFSAMLAHSGRSRASTVLALTLGALLTVVVPSAALVTRGQDMAVAALEGQAIRPFTLAGVPLLDVTAVPVDVSWIGPEQQRPAFFSTASGTLEGLTLGKGSGTVSVLVATAQGHSVVTLPSSSVILQSR